MEDVSIHAPVWGATCCDAGDARGDCVSIHAPVWGATIVQAFFDRRLVVSIHAPVWGATGRIGWRGLSATCFDPRPRVGGDWKLTNLSEAMTVSIHAPVWGATLTS